MIVLSLLAVAARLRRATSASRVAGRQHARCEPAEPHLARTSNPLHAGVVACSLVLALPPTSASPSLAAAAPLLCVLPPQIHTASFCHRVVAPALPSRTLLAGYKAELVHTSHFRQEESWLSALQALLVPLLELAAELKMGCASSSASSAYRLCPCPALRTLASPDASADTLPDSS